MSALNFTSFHLVTLTSHWINEILLFSVAPSWQNVKGLTKSIGYMPWATSAPKLKAIHPIAEQTCH